MYSIAYVFCLMKYAFLIRHSVPLLCMLIACDLCLSYTVNHTLWQAVPFFMLIMGSLYPRPHKYKKNQFFQNVSRILAICNAKFLLQSGKVSNDPPKNI